MTTKAINALDATKDIWNKMTFGGLIRSLRTSDEISQVQLAKKIAVSKQFLSDVEHNRKKLELDLLKKLHRHWAIQLNPYWNCSSNSN